jgi:hypothetical protein
MAEENPFKKGLEDIKYFLEIENPGTGVEQHYFWILTFLRNNSPSGIEFEDIIKVRDINTGTESSTYFGVIEQRKSIQQEKVSQYLATLGRMTKDIFQIVRELRIMDERKEYYDKARRGDNAAIIALKSIWVDQVEGGAKNPSSVLGLASRDVGFITLPDLFFKMEAHPRKGEQESDAVTRAIEGEKQYGLNSKIKEILKRKLQQFYVWKEKTEKEIDQRKKFVLAYLRQHYHTMRLYIDWIRPYLDNIGNLQMDYDNPNFKVPELVRAFNTTKIQIELLASQTLKGDDVKKWENNQLYRPFIKINFDYTSIPQMAYQDEQQRGAIHVGHTKIHIESHVGSKKDLDDYMKSKEKEDLEIVSSLFSSMNALGDELFDYLEEAEDETTQGRGSLKKKYLEICEKLDITPKETEYVNVVELKKWVAEVEKKESSPSILTPLTAPLKDFKEIFSSINAGFKTLVGKEGKKSIKIEGFSDVKKTAMGRSFLVYDIYKKAHGMLAW